MLSANSFSHDKSYYYDDLYNVFNNNVHSVFSGNSKSQYFTAFDKPRKGYGRQNLNNIYWADKIGDVYFYSVGMGIGNPKAGFVEVNIVGKIGRAHV